MTDLQIHEKTNIQSIQKQLSSIIELTTGQFSLRFTKFRSFEETEFGNVAVG